MTCPRCQGLVVVEPLPVEIAMLKEYAVERFGWRRCVNCGDAGDLTMARRRIREEEGVAA